MSLLVIWVYCYSQSVCIWICGILVKCIRLHMLLLLNVLSWTYCCSQKSSTLLQSSWIYFSSRMCKTEYVTRINSYNVIYVAMFTVESCSPAKLKCCYILRRELNELLQWLLKLNISLVSYGKSHTASCTFVVSLFAPVSVNKLSVKFL